jgi:adenosine/AMP kinase
VEEGLAVNIDGVAIEVPADHQLIIGQAHFIKSVEDIYETMVTSMPGLKFGVAFCEASGKALVRSDGTDNGLRELAQEYATRVASGHVFAIVMTGAFPINVLNRLKAVDEVAQIFCATSNPVTVIVADSGGGRGVLGVIDGISPRGVESDADRAERHEFLRKIGYKR